MSYKAQRIPAIFVCLFFLLTFENFAFNTPMDSIGIEKLGGKTFILHKVDPKETLYSLSKRYNVKVDLIQVENPELKAGLKEGQVLRIPFERKHQNSHSTAQNPPANKGAKIHIVEAGQTLYSISKIYKASVEDIKKWNSLNSNELSTGQEIIVGSLQNEKSASTLNKTTDGEKSSKDEVSNVPNFKYDAKGNKIHIAEQGQTLYSISHIYNTPLEEIKQWNNLSSNEISAGQAIIVAIGKQKEVVQNEKERGLDEKPVQPAQGAVVNNPAPTIKTETTKVAEAPKEPLRQTVSSTGFNKIVDRGLAEAIEESEDNPKFLALHKTAEVGTIIQVRNELNNLYIFARVIGRLPQTSTNDKLIIKLSKKAYDKLGAVDKRFPVEVSYVPND